MVTGRIHTFDGGSLEGQTVQISWDETTATTRINADGSFRLGLVESPISLVELWIDPGSRDYYPALDFLDPALLQNEIHVVMLPHNWMIRSGEYSGVRVAVSPAAAVSSPVLPAFWGPSYPFTQSGFAQTIIDSTRWTGAFKSWPSSALPLPVALDRNGALAAFSADDSTTLWQHLNRLETILGRNLFVPAEIEQLTLTTSGGFAIAEDAILVRIDDELTTRGNTQVALGAVAYLRSENTAQWSGGPAQTMSIASADIRAAVVSFSQSKHLADDRLVLHEFTHTLGADHGCTWPSVQTYCASLRTHEPTLNDVAYLELIEAARGEEMRWDTQYGILTAAFGERRSHGLPAIPHPVTLFGPDTATLDVQTTTSMFDLPR